MNCLSGASFTTDQRVILSPKFWASTIYDISGVRQESSSLLRNIYAPDRKVIQSKMGKHSERCFLIENWLLSSFKVLCATLVLRDD